MVSMEAMASGVPVVGMKAGGICDVVINGETGMLAESLQEFEAFLRRLIEDKTHRSTLGEEARRISESRTWASALDRLETSYLELIPDVQVCLS